MNSSSSERSRGFRVRKATCFAGTAEASVFLVLKLITEVFFRRNIKWLLLQKMCRICVKEPAVV